MKDFLVAILDVVGSWGIIRVWIGGGLGALIGAGLLYFAPQMAAALKPKDDKPGGVAVQQSGTGNVQNNYFGPSPPNTREETSKLIAGELLLECQLAPLPEVGLPNQTMLFKIDPFRFTDLGTIGYGTAPSEPGKPFPWPAEWKNKMSSARCKVTNYGKAPIFNVEIPFKITFVRIERGENPGSTIAKNIINVEEGIVPITKLDPGNEGAYIFYIHNQGRDIVHPEFADKATCLPIGATSRTSVKIIQPADVMHHAGPIWPVRNPLDIVQDAEEQALQAPLAPKTPEKQ